MYLKVIKRERVRRGKRDYRVRYFDSESPEGRLELLKRYYGLKELRPGSYFSLDVPIDDSFYDWTGGENESPLN